MLLTGGKKFTHELKVAPCKCTSLKSTRFLQTNKVGYFSNRVVFCYFTFWDFPFTLILTEQCAAFYKERVCQADVLLPAHPVLCPYNTDPQESPRCYRQVHPGAGHGGVWGQRLLQRVSRDISYSEDFYSFTLMGGPHFENRNKRDCICFWWGGHCCPVHCDVLRSIVLPRILILGREYVD